MNGKRMGALIAILLTVTVIMAFAIDADAGTDRTFSSEVSYFDGFVIVQGTVPYDYANDQSHIEIEIQSSDGIQLAVGYAEPTEDGVFKQLVKYPLSKGQYKICIYLKGSGNQTVETVKDLIIDDSTVVAVSSISLSPSSKEMTVGSSITLVCTINPVTASNQYISWTSSNSSIASVDDMGKVSANGVGTAVITATSIGGKEATSTIAVKAASGGGPSSTSMSISASSYTAYAGGSSITLTASYPSSIGSDSLRWSVSPLNYASFTESSTMGKSTVHLEGKAVGTVTVTLSSVATSSTASIRISVVEKPDSDYSFFLRMDIDYDKADYGTSGLSASDLKSGITLTGSGSNAGVALEKALKANNVPCSFWSGGDILYWVDSIFGLGDYKYSNGDWKYWIQYHDGSYNEWTLGHYTDGGSFELIYGITNEDGQVVKPEQHDDDSGSSTTTNPDGSKTTEVINPDGSKTETTTGKPITTTDKDGNKTTTTPSTSTEYDKDGNVVGKTESTKTEVKNADGSQNVTEVEVSKDKDGNVTGSTETSETKDKDGNVTGTSNVVKDAAGKEISYEKTEIQPERTVTDSEGNKVTESSSKKDVKDETGKVTVTGESVKEVVGTDGSKETEKSKSESVTEANGSTTSTKVVESTKEDADSTLRSVQTETKAADGKETAEKKVEAESKDGIVKSSAEVSAGSDKAEIVTVINTDSDNGIIAVSADQVEKAISIQEKVSDSISSDVKDPTKVILVESDTADASLTVSKDAVKAVSDSGSELKMVTEEGSMQISKEILENLSDVDDVTISFSKSEDAVKEKMTDAQKGAVDENATVLELKVTSGDTSLGDRLGGTLTVTVKHKQAEGMTAVAYYIADDGTKEKLEGSYDSDKEEMSFATTHCSIYAVVDEAPLVDDGGDSDSNTMMYIGIAVAVIAIIAVAGILYMRKN